MSTNGARLRCGLDVSPLALTRAGPARYLVNLLEGLRAVDSVEVVTLGFEAAGRPAKIARDAVWYPAVLPLAARRRRLDVLHCPTIRAPFRSPVPLVVTVHDLAPLRHPEAFNTWSRHYSAFALPRVVRAARALVTDSAFQRAELEELLGVPPDRVDVIPLGVGAPFTEPGPAAEGDYVLAVGTREPRKNLPAVVEGFRRAALPGCELRLVGAAGWGGVGVGGDGVRVLGRVSDEELAALYRGARCLVYAPRYEGFGLPVLEAMAAGTAVVCPAGGPFDEFAAGVAVTCDPGDPDSLAAAISAAVSRRSELGPRGQERAAAFTWERTARGTLDVYRRAAA